MHERATDTESQPQPLFGEIFIVLLALASVGLLIFELGASLRPEQEALIQTVDLVIASIFLVEFMIRFWRAEKKGHFLRTSWWELLAAIPLTDSTVRALRGLRVLRVIRIIRILRVIRLGVRIHLLAERARAFGDDSHLVPISVTVATIVASATAAFHFFEYGVNPNVRGFGDSLWWGIVTVTTVGYGDVVPVTTEGRVVTVALLIFGLGAFGVYTATIANAVMKRKNADQ